MGKDLPKAATTIYHKEYTQSSQEIGKTLEMEHDKQSVVLQKQHSRQNMLV